MIKVSEQYCDREIYSEISNNKDYQALKETLIAALVSSSSVDIIDVEGDINLMGAMVADRIYKKAFHDGMRFILNAMAGKDVIEI